VFIGWACHLRIVQRRPHFLQLFLTLRGLLSQRHRDVFHDLRINLFLDLLRYLGPHLFLDMDPVEQIISALAQEQQNLRHGLRNSNSDVFLDVLSCLLDSCVVRFLMLPKLVL
jgi:hypothetical protein